MMKRPKGLEELLELLWADLLQLDTRCHATLTRIRPIERHGNWTLGVLMSINSNLAAKS